MERFKQLLHRLLFPPRPVLWRLVPVAAALLIYTFAYGEETSPGAYTAYVLSAYATVILCARLSRISLSGVRETLHRNPYAHRYLTDIPFKTHVSLYLSFGLNLVFAIMKFGFGIWYGSVWFGTLAVYYTLLSVMRFLLLRHVNRAGIGQGPVLELKLFRLCGVILLLMNSALADIVILVVQKNEGFHFPGYLIYAFALYAFYNMITAVRDVIRYRKYKSPVMSAAKIIKLASALVSMLTLETAMLMQFGTGENSPLFRQVMTAATGGCVCLIVLALAVGMIVHATKRLAALSGEQS